MITDRIRQLEARSRELEPDAAARDGVRRRVLGYAEGFLERLDGVPAYRGDDAVARRLRGAPISEDGLEVEELLDLFGECVDTPGINPASPRHLGYIPGGGLYHAALGDYLAAVTNRYVGLRFASPGAVELENATLDWMADLVGFPRSSGGVLTVGGSVANLIAIVTAREAAELSAADFARAVVYMTDDAHHCLDKGLRIAGLGECVIRRVPMDDRWRMRPEPLDAAIRADRRNGLAPWMVVATAGTTDVGAVDPLEPIGRVAADHGLWYHVDAAYGGFFALVDALRPRLEGMSLADSLVLDPHKGLFLPFGTGAVLVKDKAALLRAHSYRADYLQDAGTAALDDASPGDMSPEFSRHFRGPRLWLPLQLHGVGAFRAALEEKHLLARYFHQQVRRLGFEVGPEPELSVATYRYLPPAGDADAFNQALVGAIHRDGRVFVSSTRLGDAFFLRAAVLSFRTHLEHVDLYLKVLDAEARRLLATR